ncbi:unnamed protein product [Thelazia callipaeda]|uniref:TMEM132 domain-containing protein n=1 Tax=Thelazia callipaeda TaxID=103827 RepID=A0A0N5CLS1_THECL|nr:unnamed protein product [Thelazia callipaeda]
MQDGCPSRLSSIVGTQSGRRHVLALDRIRRLECAVMIKIASNIISLEKPFVDFVAVSDISILSHLRQSLCITTQLAFSTSTTASMSCIISPYDSVHHSCLLRIIVPYSWFPINNDQNQVITLVHKVDKECGEQQAESHRTKLTLLSPFANYKSYDIDKQSSVLHLRLLSPTNFTFACDSLSTLLLYLNYSGENEMVLNAIEIKVWLNNRFKIINVTSANIKLWKVEMEKPVSSSDSLIIITSKRLPIISSNDYSQRFDGYLMMMLVKVKSVAESESESHPNKMDDDLINVHWEVQYDIEGKSSNTSKMGSHRTTTKFRIYSDFVYSIVPMIKGENVINTAVLSGKQTAVPMRIFSVTEGGHLEDVTSNSHCLSAESRVLKASPTCSSIYVDGSELRGMGKVKIHVHFETLTTSIEITVWYPRFPITVWISDPVLNAVKDWQIAVWKWLPSRRRREARQFGCTNKYQQAEVRILASYYIGDKDTGERIYLSGDRDILFDVTSLTVNHVHSTNLGVAVVLPRQDRIFVIANHPGSARITVRSNIPSIDYGSAPIVVTEDVVTVRRLVVEGVVDIALDIERIPKRLDKYVVSTFIQNTLTRKYQHATIVCRLYFSDEQALELNDIPSDQYVLQTWTSDDQAVALNHGPNGQNTELIVLQNAKNVLLSVSLHSPTQCRELDSRALIQIDYPVQIEFNERKKLATTPTAFFYNSSTKLESEDDSGNWNSQVLLGLIILLAALIGIVHAIGSRARRPLNKGYEKLVLPILTRLSSSSSCGKDENSQEWVWLSKAEIDSCSINSRYSQKSTIDAAENSSHASNGSTQRSISYRGSEISVFISPQPAVAINLDSLGRHTTSWRGRPKTKLTRNAMIDNSSSEHNLSKYSNANSSGYGFVPVNCAAYEKSPRCKKGVLEASVPQQICWRQMNRNFSHDSISETDEIRETLA